MIVILGRVGLESCMVTVKGGVHAEGERWRGYRAIIRLAVKCEAKYFDFECVVKYKGVTEVGYQKGIRIGRCG